MTTVEIHHLRVQDIFLLRHEIWNPYVAGLADDVAAVARRKVRRRTGNLARSITSRTEIGTYGLDGVVEANAAHATAHHEGSKPHIIRARSRKALHFFWERMNNLETFAPRQPTTHGIRGGGVLIIGKGFVNHPGTTPNRFLTEALQEVIGNG